MLADQLVPTDIELLVSPSQITTAADAPPEANAAMEHTSAREAIRFETNMGNSPEVKGFKNLSKVRANTEESTTCAEVLPRVSISPTPASAHSARHETLLDLRCLGVAQNRKGGVTGATGGWYGRRMKTQIDHLVVVAQTLDAGVAWCEATIGITPGPGGEHARYGTHNRLFKIASPTSPLAYLEIIAINPAAKRGDADPARRWFDMDDGALQAAVSVEPRLVHFVANTDDIGAAVATLQAQGIDRGPVVSASRHSRRGLLQWQITVRDDGQRLFDGALPSLIQWGKPGAAEPLRLHPRNSLPRSGVTLKGMVITHPSATRLQAAFDAIGLAGIAIATGPANLAASLQTPKGLVVLQSLGI